ncbi:class I SAM-dependent methyltransferase [Nocardia sp. CA2R105]|uniref:class I SAM-dependent methyltransferase n=1 Tax=Nocardia coffeae TaxID=2873381 RepID=UPI001CA7558C|nr:class I SAM-dependent methyltransferase [Nocardia coffeae]MBY8858481.1 class I SAM-dependent methyltransferase [Nocardia coffeae]
MSHDHDHQHGGHDHDHHHPHGGHDHGDESALADLLDLDAEALPEYLPEVTALIRDHLDDRPVRRILDMGAGTGSGALALAQRFPDAEITAVDVSEFMLTRLRDKAGARGVAERIHTLRADLDAAWPELEPVDLAWAANSLHHTADPDRVLTDLFGTIRPGGLLALAELNSMPRFLSTAGELGELEDRAHEALAAETADHVPHLGSDWASLLTKAGFEIDTERRIVISLTPPLPEAAARLAHRTLQRMHTGLAERLSPQDATALDVLLSDGPDGLARRSDLTVRDERPVWIARRP